MLHPRIIPCLLVKDDGLVKTVNFNNPKYVGDPINAVRIFNEKEVDEIIVLDIDATAKKAEPNYKMIDHLASECRMPLCYGGGVKTVEHIQRIISLGVEKVAISSAAMEDPDLVAQAAERVGSQSVVAVLDIRKDIRSDNYEIWIRNGQVNTGKSPVEMSQRLEKLGVGEIVLNSIDNDGLMKGYDLDLVDMVRRAVKTPITVLGGAGSLQDISVLINKYKTIGAAAGSLFVFKGKYKAVLISYPSRLEMRRISEYCV